VNLLTPNILEAEKIAKNKIQTMDDMEKAACLMSEKYHIDVLLKGGHLDGVMAPDILCQAGECTWFELKRINTKNTHGTGCTLSAAIASYIAQGQSLQQAVFNAKHYLFEAILFGSKLSLGEGYGPVHHFYGLNQHASLINYTRTPRTS
ncbi:MAG: hydroxymethylpyrimidine/phosphomethylpyrimidine kinase, partial [Gammaproteobacteria bacterium]|nr:hydroxymethylpyrimidine/phosphomethylpyrimidine kinase [Gammaproteobacteria bacterium]